MKIAVYDSGIGGLTVLARLISAFPDCDYLYYADNANFPFGQKNVNTLKANIADTVNFLKKESDLQVIACYTASTLIPKDKTTFTVKPEIENENTLLIATPNTIKNLSPKCKIADTPCLAYIIQTTLLNERNFESVDNYLFDTLSEFIKTELVSIGCTHYNYIKKNIKALLGAEKILDGTDLLLEELDKEILPSAHTGRLSFGFSAGDESEVYTKMLKRILSREFN
ncbi:MAG: glutamate racemase [Christensenellales bacterium]